MTTPTEAPSEILATNVCIVDDYTLSRMQPQPVMTMFSLFQPAIQPIPAEVPDETPSEVVADEPPAEIADTVTETKVVTAPAKPDAKATTDNVETK